MSGPKSMREHCRLDRGDDRFQTESKAPATSVEWLAGMDLGDSDRVL